MYVLYTKIANITQQNANSLQRDRVIISKEHCYAGRVCLLARLGLIPASYLDTYIKKNGKLAHDIYGFVGDKEIAALDVSSGSLGHGLGVGAGLAIGSPNNRVYVIVGDGELQEGSCWEALNFIGYQNIKNITVIVDKNNMQIDGFCKDIADNGNLANKIASFGFDIVECDGHNLADIQKAFEVKTSKPKCIIANTIKGKELTFLLEKRETPLEYHCCPIPDDLLDETLEKINDSAR